MSTNQNTQVPWDMTYDRCLDPNNPWSSSLTVLSGLKARELHGRVRRSDTIAPGVIPQIQFPFTWNSECLASVAAWNLKRLQNMILSVGPGTPASLVLSSIREKDDSSDISHSITIEGGEDEEDQESQGIFIDMVHPSIYTLTRSHERIIESVEPDDEDDDDSSDEKSEKDEESVESSKNNNNDYHRHVEKSDSSSSKVQRPKRMREERSGHSTASSELQSAIESDLQSTPISASTLNERTRQRVLNNPNRTRLYDGASMKHNGCINAAVWLTCSWRLSLAHTVETNNQSHSLIFSSSHSSNADAGSSLSGKPVDVMDNEYPTQTVTSGDDRLVKFWDVSHSMGMAFPETCFTPFSSSYPVDGVESSIVKRWRRKYKQGFILPGIVRPLASIKTGHRGNVFHVSPITEKPGKVLTCGADGYLLLSDVEQQSSASSSWMASTVVVSPRMNEDISNLGNASLLGLGEMCYSHVMVDANTGLLCGNEGLHRFDLRLPSHSQPQRSILGDGPCKACAVWPLSDAFRRTYLTDSTYIFAGGSGPTVNMYDLRYITDDGCNIIETYTPSKLYGCKNVSVSGIDVSRDKREILISYENDVIYTFPIFPGIKSAAGPTLDDLDERSLCSGSLCAQERASYGAHLNRLTFLKCAKYAGPTDEYICTGSDSGHAWIYEKATGAVAALLKADQTTCNGVVPHPCFPFFLTYGIDSTAKLWKATIPVGDDIDDSAIGRCKHLHERTYEQSAVVSDWKRAEANASMTVEMGVDNIQILPDDFPSHEAMTESDFMLGSFSRFILRALSSESKCFRIRNDLHNLPLILSQNLCTCIRAYHEDDDLPIQSSLSEFKHRISIMRIHHQLDELGYSSYMNALEFLLKEAWKKGFQIPDHHNIDMVGNHAFLPDLIPEHPSDWFPYDFQFSAKPFSFGIQSNNTGENRFKYRCCRWKRSITAKPTADVNITPVIYDQDAHHILCDIVILLKDYGNLALKLGKVRLSAKYYDKAIRFCSGMYLPCEYGPSEFLSDGQNNFLSNGAYINEWTTLFKLFLSIRLNLSAVMMKSEISDYDCASKQAQLVIDALKPFTAAEGKVLSGFELKTLSDNEPETFIEANSIKAKAYFRLGNAKFLMDDYSAAARCFENSIKATKTAHLQPESVVVRRLSEARAAKARKVGG